MRLESLYIQNLLGIVSADLQLDTPVTVLAGANGAGKSSLRDAIALALTADLGRVHQKKDAPQLIHDGAESAVVELIDSDGDSYAVTISAKGKITDSQKGRETDPVFAYVLDAQRFARLDEKERRAFLFGLMDLKTDGKAITARLLAKGCDPKKVERIAPMLRSGFEAAHKDAKGKATEAKGAWRQLTGEAYGSEKAKTWQAGVPKINAEHLPTLQTELKHADAALATWNQTIGNLTATKTRRVTLAAKLPALDERAGLLARHRTKLATDEQVLKDLEADIARTAAAAGAGPRVGLVHKLADHMDLMLDHGERMGWFSDNGDRDVQQMARALVEAYEDEHGKLDATTGDPEAAARLPALRQAHATTTSAIANDRRDIDAAMAAAAEAASIREELKEPFDLKQLDDANAHVADIQAKRAATQQQLDTQAALKREADAAVAKTKEAAQHHADVQAWDAIGDALAPDGIPGEILGEALGPINDRLSQSALDTEWPRVEITADMQIRTGLHERPYSLLSESEQWRCDAMIAEAVSHISKVGLLVLDRFDVLDLQGRSQLLGWLDLLAENGEIHSALVFGTLKALPTNLPATTRAHWIADGRVGAAERREVAEAA